MKLLKLHTKPISIAYKESICSIAFYIVFFLALASVLLPIWFVSVFSPFSAVSSVHSYHEQPKVKFKFNYLIYMSDEIHYDSILSCSSFAHFNKLTKNFQKCPIIKHWTYDTNHDDIIDNSYIELLFNNTFKFTKKLKVYLIFFYEAALETKCPLKPPAILINELEIPADNFNYSEIDIIGKLDLKQNIEFFCPCYGRRSVTHFQNKIFSSNATQAQIYSVGSIRNKITQNPAYFEFQQTEFYKKMTFYSDFKLKIKIVLNIDEIETRYHLSLWERLGKLWLYLASFFGVSFYVCNKIKDFLFTRHYVNSWEVTLWKKCV